VGFITKRVAIIDLGKEIYFVLEDYIEDLNSVIIESERVTAEEVIKTVIQKIPENYTQEPYTQYKLYKIRPKKEGQFQHLEKIEEEYDENGYTASPMHGLGKRESFHITKQARKGKLDHDTNEIVEFTNISGFSTPTAWSDVVNSRNNNFLSKSKYKKYDFQFNEKSVLNEDTIHIDFEIMNPSHQSTTAIGPIKFYGTLIIDANSYAVLEVQSTAIVNKKKYWKSKNNLAYESEEVWLAKEILKYKRVGMKYYFSSLLRDTNYDQRGLIEVKGLRIIEGKRVPQESAFRAVEPYNLSDWEKLLEGNWE